jgi:CDP-paratose 2-epimerase
MSGKILITGGAGFIGSNTARHFLKNGWQTTLFDNLSRKGTEFNLKNLAHDYKSGIKLIEGDVRYDRKILADLMENHDAVIHLAGQVAVTNSITNPRHDFENNVIGTFNVLEAIRESQNKPPLIYSSTNKVYGALESLPIEEKNTRFAFADDPHKTYGVPETQPVDFHSPYGCSKGAAEQYILDYARIYGLKTVAFRQSCIYGPHQIGVEDQGWVAWFSIAALLGQPITIYGTGKQTRDLLYVNDLTTLYEKALENMPKISGRAYNIGGGPTNTLSVRELLDNLRTRGILKIDPDYSTARPGDQPVFIADVRQAEKDLGWKPKIAIDEGIKEMGSWMQNHKDSIASFFKN